MKHRILVITECSRSKTYDIYNREIQQLLKKKKLPIPTFNVQKEKDYRKILKRFTLPANEMYQGSFKDVKRFVEKLREQGLTVDFYTISARYGLIPERRKVIPYDASFSDLSKKELAALAEKLRIYDRFRSILKWKSYDRIVIIASEKYLLALFGNNLEGLKRLRAKTRRKIFVLSSPKMCAVLRALEVNAEGVEGHGFKKIKIHELLYRFLNENRLKNIGS